MFVTVQGLTKMMDKDLQYLKEAYENESNFDKKEFSDYIEKMKNLLNARYDKLVKESTNDRLIEKYKIKIQKAFK